MATLPITVGHPQVTENGTKTIAVVRGDGRVAMVFVYPDGASYLGILGRGGLTKDGPMSEEDAIARAKVIVAGML